MTKSRYDGRELDSILKLNIGCGNDCPNYFINVDIREDTPADIICDVRKLPFDDGRFQHIESHDVLEHISHRETYQTLKEWFRVLKKGGTFRFIVPNLLVAFESIKINDYGTAINIIYGAQDYPENKHLMGFTPYNIRVILETMGLKRVVIQPQNLHIIVEGIKE